MLGTTTVSSFVLMLRKHSALEMDWGLHPMRDAIMSTDAAEASAMFELSEPAEDEMATILMLER